MFEVFLSILSSAILPILGIVGLGYVLQRWRPMESGTLVTLNLYFFVPAYLFVRVLESSLSWWDITQVGAMVLLPIVTVGSLVYFLFLSRSALRGETVAALLVGSLFANAGNFGLPVAELAFGARGGEVHAIIVLFANFSIFSIAYAILAVGKGQGVSTVLNYFKLPYFYCIVAGLVIRDCGLPLPKWIVVCCNSIAQGLVPIALVTLGSQLASHARWPDWRIVAPSLVIKLALFPMVSFAGVWLFGLWPWPGVVLVLAASAPAAINPLILAMELDGDTDSLSDCVFWTTLFSAFTVAVWMTALKSAHPEAFP